MIVAQRIARPLRDHVGLAGRAYRDGGRRERRPRPRYRSDVPRITGSRVIVLQRIVIALGDHVGLVGLGGRAYYDGGCRERGSRPSYRSDGPLVPGVCII